MKLSRIAITLAHALAGWALCDATMMIGMAVTSLDNALIIHAIAAPVFFAVISLVYFRYFNYTSPLRTALIFTAFIITVDFFFVAMLINRSFAMFTSLLGTCIPFALIFASTYLTGTLVRRPGIVVKPS
jgi:hypothetical protein